MSQETLVVMIPSEERSALRSRLSDAQFEFRTVPHALFSVKGEGVVATLYRSGKFVVQGAEPAFFLARFAGRDVPPTEEKPAVAPPDVSNRTTVGSDETGKGDFFGPLVVCAVRLEAPQARELAKAGVMDSKRLTDNRALQLGALLRGQVQHSVQVLMPSEYNGLWEELGLHTLLSRQHASAIREVAQHGDRVVIDQFSKKDEIGPALTDLALDIEQRPRAESEIAVAAASIIARGEFLTSLRELGQEFGVELRKGAGPPADQAGVEFSNRHGTERLAEVAKVHFKNSEKVKELLRRG